MAEAAPAQRTTIPFEREAPQRPMPDVANAGEKLLCSYPSLCCDVASSIDYGHGNDACENKQYIITNRNNTPAEKKNIITTFGQLYNIQWIGLKQIPKVYIS